MNRKNLENFEKNRVFSSSLSKDPEFLKLKGLFLEAKEKFHLNGAELLTKKIEKKEILIPVGVFSEKLSSLETIVKYLKENLGLKNKEIAKITKRSVKTIYQAYSSANEKSGKKFEIKEAKYYIPASALTNRKLGVLESVVKFLKENYELNYSEIGRLLGRDPRTIWTAYSRGKKKSVR